jgi:methionyl-tRNA synthetase
MHPFEDSDFTMEKFKEAYTANLVNGIGNLTSRIMKMAEDYGVSLGLNKNFVTKSSPYLNTFNIHQYTNKIWAEIQELDEYIQKEQPFKKIKINEDEAKNDLKFLISRLNKIAVDLKPIMPETSKKILKAIKENKKPDEPLFPRK